MQYLLLIYNNEAEMAAARGTTADGEMMSAYVDFTRDIVRTGHFKAGDALQPTTVRVRDGKTLITDGPFAETREQLGGYYMIDAKDLDEATAIAARIPGAWSGSVEVRPVMVFSNGPA